ncbi:hypothetical protein D3C77_134290 [compost metagenome]
MSQHDMDVANGPGLTFRSDMNAALQALASQSSGASEPSPIFPCQVWGDTGTGRLKQRNSTNTTWLDKGPLNSLGEIQAIASAPLTDIGATPSQVIAISGVATITGLGTADVGVRRKVRFLAALVLTHNATALILPGGLNITTVAGDSAEFLSLGSGNWQCLRYTRASGFALYQSGKNLFLNPRFRINQRGYVSGTAAAAGQYTLDRLKMTLAGQSLVLAPSGTGVRATFPAGGCDQIVIGENVRGGVYTLSWVGTAVGKVNGVVIANGGQTAALPAGVNITINLSGGWAEDVVFQLGTAPTPLGDQGEAAELFDCQYYGYAMVPSVNFQGICTVSFVYSGLIGLGVLRFPRAMRANPTVSFLAGGPSSMVVNTPDGNSTPLTNLGVSVLARESCNLLATQGLSWDLGASSVLNFGATAVNLFFSAEV